MSNYTKATNFTLKDGLVTGDVNKIIKGSEIDAEYVAISNAISSKADLNDPTFTGAVNSSQPPTGNSSSRVATTLFVQNALVGAYPVGSIYMNATDNTNPATLLGFGTWTAFGAGRVPVGINSGDTAFDTVEETGGSKDAVLVSHTHTAAVSDPGHAHGYTRATTTSGLEAGPHPVHPASVSDTTTTAVTNITVANSTEGVSATNANLQPYIVVYMWKRTL